MTVCIPGFVIVGFPIPGFEKPGLAVPGPGVIVGGATGGAKVGAVGALGIVMLEPDGSCGASNCIKRTVCRL